jgi:hypothetical protein
MESEIWLILDKWLSYENAKVKEVDDEIKIGKNDLSMRFKKKNRE